MKCKRCNNEDKNKFYEWKGTWYCRNCIRFGKVELNQELVTPKLSTNKIATTYHLDYELTNEQKGLMKEIQKRIQKKPILIYAACGAGKTETTMQQIAQYIGEGKKVGYAISRRQVVLEIAQRLQQAFKNVKITPVCAGYTTKIDGDIIVCTIHQLYRYHQTFDLLIMDEIDAFPYEGNMVLEAIAENACKGELLMLTATPSEKLKEQVKNHQIEQVTLFQRHHGKPLVEAKILCLPKGFQYIVMYYLIKREKKDKWIIFLPTIHQVEMIYKIMKYVCKCAMISSISENKEQVMEQLRCGIIQVVFATTILERGITIEGVNVGIIEADHHVYKESSLIQMIGRVGRKAAYPTGYAYMLAKRKTKEMKQCCQTIKWMNQKSTNV